MRAAAYSAPRPSTVSAMPGNGHIATYASTHQGAQRPARSSRTMTAGSAGEVGIEAEGIALHGLQGKRDAGRQGRRLGQQGQRTFTQCARIAERDRKSTRLNSSHSQISYAVFCLKKKKSKNARAQR